MPLPCKDGAEASSVPYTGTRQHQPTYTRIIQNFRLIWLDANIDAANENDYRDTIRQLKHTVNSIEIFTDADECISFLTDIKDEKVFLIVNGYVGQRITPLIHNMPQLDSIYVCCGNKSRHEQWTKQWLKIKGVLTDISSIYELIKQAAQQCDRNNISISFVTTSNDTSHENLDKLNQSFMYTQILKEILLTIDFNESHIKEFADYCRLQFIGNVPALSKVDKFERKYREHSPIWWYTSESFLHPMLNRALRLMDVDIIVKLGFFVSDLHRHISQLHHEQFRDHNQSQPFKVYRGQGLSKSDFDQMMQTKDKLISFNNFLSTSRNQDVSIMFADSSQSNPNWIGVLFEITVDPSETLTTFAFVNEVSPYEAEDEILFSMHAVFRIRDIEETTHRSRLWKVELTLTSDKDKKLSDLTEHTQKQTEGWTGWYKLGYFFISLGQFDKAQILLEALLDQTNDNEQDAFIFELLGIIKKGKGEYSKALSYYEKALGIQQETLPANHPSLATSYSNIGQVYFNMGEYSKALSYYKIDLKTTQEARPANHPSLATSYSNIGQVYSNMGEYSKALSYYEKALGIYQEAFPANHPSLATSYSNIGQVYSNMGKYSKALSYHEKALGMRQETLPPNHPSLATSYSNIGQVYFNMGEYSKALSYYKIDLKITQEALPANHPSLATSYSNIGQVYSNMGEYSKALSYYEKALGMRQETLPANHPSLATSRRYIGQIYNSLGEYSKALSCHEEALKIYQTSLPANHPALARAYSNICQVHANMKEYSKALGSEKKALEIRQESLHGNHPELATSYSNMGEVYCKIDDCSKALTFHEKALGIRLKSLLPTHPDLGTSYNNIGLVYLKTGDFLKALSLYEQALEIRQKALPENHPDLAATYNNIGQLNANLNEQSKAISFYERAIAVGEQSLPENHPHLQIYREKLKCVRKKL